MTGVLVCRLNVALPVGSYQGLVILTLEMGTDLLLKMQCFIYCLFVTTALNFETPHGG